MATGGTVAPPVALVSDDWPTVDSSSSRRARRRRSRGLGRARGRGDSSDLHSLDGSAGLECASAEAARLDEPATASEVHVACPAADVSDSGTGPNVHVSNEGGAEPAGGVVAGGADASTSSVAGGDSYADEAEQRARLGEQLYPLVVALRPDRAGKVVGMILELGAVEVMALLDSSADLATIVAECHDILEANDASVASASDEAIASELQQQEKQIAKSGSRADAAASVAALHHAGSLAAVSTAADRDLELALAVSAAEADLALGAPSAVEVAESAAVLSSPISRGVAVSSFNARMSAGTLSSSAGALTDLVVQAVSPVIEEAQEVLVTREQPPFDVRTAIGAVAVPPPSETRTGPSALISGVEPSCQEPSGASALRPTSDTSSATILAAADAVGSRRRQQEAADFASTTTARTDDAALLTPELAAADSDSRAVASQSSSGGGDARTQLAPFLMRGDGLAELPRPQHACLLVAGFSVHHQAAAVLLVKRAGATELYMVPGGMMDEGDSDGADCAFREFAEEFYGRRGSEARSVGRTLRTRAEKAGVLHGPFGSLGSASLHQSFVLMTAPPAGSIDAVAKAFVVNGEASAALLVPVSSLSGSSTWAVTFEGVRIQLRDRLGYKRVLALQDLFGLLGSVGDGVIAPVADAVVVPGGDAPLSCAYCGNTAVASLVVGVSTQRAFCNGVQPGLHASCAVYHLRKRPEAVRVSAGRGGAAPGVVLSCVHTGAYNVFELSVLRCESKTVLVGAGVEAGDALTASLTSVAAGAAPADGARTALVETSGRFDVSIVPDVRGVPPRAVVTRSSVDRLEALWHERPDATLADALREPARAARVPLVYASREHFVSVHSRLTRLGAVHEARAAELLEQPLTAVRWFSAEVAVFRLGSGANTRLKAGAGVAFTFADSSTADGDVIVVEGDVVAVVCSDAGVAAGEVTVATVHFIPADVDFSRQQTALQLFAAQPDCVGSALAARLLGCCVNVMPFAIPRSSTRQLHVAADPLLQSLTAAQRAAIGQALCEPLTLWQGPPGCGKTTTIVALVRVLVSVYSGVPIKVMSQTNSAVDNLASKLDSAGLLVFRVPKSRELPGYLAQHPRVVSHEAGWATTISLLEARRERGLLDSKGAAALAECVGRAARYLLSTSQAVCCTLSGSMSALLMSRRFPVALVDEATQATEAQLFMGLVQGCNHLVLVGDQAQLAPTVVSREAAADGAGLPTFTRLVRARVVEPLLLDTQFRMHPALASYPNKAFYGGRVVDGLDACDRASSVRFPWPRDAAGEVTPLVMYNVPGAESAGSSGTSKLNRDEAHCVLQLLRVFLGAGATAEQLLVLTGYSAQRSYIRHLLCGTPGSDVSVKSVDEAEGREFDFVLLTVVCTRATPDGRIGHMSDPKRVNVALTRARYGLAVLGNVECLGAALSWREYVADMTQRGLVTSMMPVAPMAAASPLPSPPSSPPRLAGDGFYGCLWRAFSGARTAFREVCTAVVGTALGAADTVALLPPASPLRPLPRRHFAHDFEDVVAADTVQLPPSASPLLPALDGPGRRWLVLRGSRNLNKMAEVESFVRLVIDNGWLEAAPGLGGRVLERTFVRAGHYAAFAGAASLLPYPEVVVGRAAGVRNGVAYEGVGATAIAAVDALALVLLRSLSLSFRYELQAYQVSRYAPRSSRGWHFDPVRQGDVIVTLTFEGSGVVQLQVPDAVDAWGRALSVPCVQRPCEYYAIFGPCLAPLQHSVLAGSSGRLSVTLRFVRLRDGVSPPPSPPGSVMDVTSTAVVVSDPSSALSDVALLDVCDADAWAGVDDLVSLLLPGVAGDVAAVGGGGDSGGGVEERKQGSRLRPRDAVAWLRQFVLFLRSRVFGVMTSAQCVLYWRYANGGAASHERLQALVLAARQTTVLPVDAKSRIYHDAIRNKAAGATGLRSELLAAMHTAELSAAQTSRVLQFVEDLVSTSSVVRLSLVRVLLASDVPEDEPKYADVHRLARQLATARRTQQLVLGVSEVLLTGALRAPGALRGHIQRRRFFFVVRRCRCEYGSRAAVGDMLNTGMLDECRARVLAVCQHWESTYVVYLRRHRPDAVVVHGCCGDALSVDGARKAGMPGVAIDIKGLTQTARRYFNRSEGPPVSFQIGDATSLAIRQQALQAHSASALNVFNLYTPSCQPEAVGYLIAGTEAPIETRSLLQSLCVLEDQFTQDGVPYLVETTLGSRKRIGSRAHCIEYGLGYGYATMDPHLYIYNAQFPFIAEQAIVDNLQQLRLYACAGRSRSLPPLHPCGLRCDCCDGVTKSLYGQPTDSVRALGRVIGAHKDHVNKKEQRHRVLDMLPLLMGRLVTGQFMGHACDRLFALPLVTATEAALDPLLDAWLRLLLERAPSQLPPLPVRRAVFVLRSAEEPTAICVLNGALPSAEFAACGGGSLLAKAAEALASVPGAPQVSPHSLRFVCDGLGCTVPSVLLFAVCELTVDNRMSVCDYVAQLLEDGPFRSESAEALSAFNGNANSRFCAEALSPLGDESTRFNQVRSAISAAPPVAAIAALHVGRRKSKQVDSVPAASVPLATLAVGSLLAPHQRDDGLADAANNLALPEGRSSRGGQGFTPGSTVTRQAVGCVVYQGPNALVFNDDGRNLRIYTAWLGHGVVLRDRDSKVLVDDDNADDALSLEPSKVVAALTGQLAVVFGGRSVLELIKTRLRNAVEARPGGDAMCDLRSSGRDGRGRFSNVDFVTQYKLWRVNVDADFELGTLAQPATLGNLTLPHGVEEMRRAPDGVLYSEAEFKVHERAATAGETPPVWDDAVKVRTPGPHCRLLHVARDGQPWEQGAGVIMRRDLAERSPLATVRTVAEAPFDNFALRSMPHSQLVEILATQGSVVLSKAVSMLERDVAGAALVEVGALEGGDSLAVDESISPHDRPLRICGNHLPGSAFVHLDENAFVLLQVALWTGCRCGLQQRALAMVSASQALWLAYQSAEEHAWDLELAPVVWLGFRSDFYGMLLVDGFGWRKDVDLRRNNGAVLSLKAGCVLAAYDDTDTLGSVVFRRIRFRHEARAFEYLLREYKDSVHVLGYREPVATLELWLYQMVTRSDSACVDRRCHGFGAGGRSAVVALFLGLVPADVLVADGANVSKLDVDAEFRVDAISFEQRICEEEMAPEPVTEATDGGVSVEEALQPGNDPRFLAPPTNLVPPELATQVAAVWDFDRPGADGGDAASESSEESTDSDSAVSVASGTSAVRGNEVAAVEQLASGVSSPRIVELDVADGAPDTAVIDGPDGCDSGVLVAATAGYPPSGDIAASGLDADPLAFAADTRSSDPVVAETAGSLELETDEFEEFGASGEPTAQAVGAAEWVDSWDSDDEVPLAQLTAPLRAAMATADAQRLASTLIGVRWRQFRARRVALEMALSQSLPCDVGAVEGLAPGQLAGLSVLSLMEPTSDSKVLSVPPSVKSAPPRAFRLVARDGVAAESVQAQYDLLCYVTDCVSVEPYGVGALLADLAPDACPYRDRVRSGTGRYATQDSRATPGTITVGKALIGDLHVVGMNAQWMPGRGRRNCDVQPAPRDTASNRRQWLEQCIGHLSDWLWSHADCTSVAVHAPSADFGDVTELLQWLRASQFDRVAVTLVVDSATELERMRSLVASRHAVLDAATRQAKAAAAQCSDPWESALFTAVATEVHAIARRDQVGHDAKEDPASVARAVLDQAMWLSSPAHPSERARRRRLVRSGAPLGALVVDDDVERLELGGDDASPLPLDAQLRSQLLAAGCEIDCEDGEWRYVATVGDVNDSRRAAAAAKLLELAHVWRVSSDAHELGRSAFALRWCAAKIEAKAEEQRTQIQQAVARDHRAYRDRLIDAYVREGTVRGEAVCLNRDGTVSEVGSSTVAVPAQRRGCVSPFSTASTQATAAAFRFARGELSSPELRVALGDVLASLSAAVALGDGESSGGLAEEEGNVDVFREAAAITVDLASLLAAEQDDDEAGLELLHRIMELTRTAADEPVVLLPTPASSATLPPFTCSFRSDGGLLEPRNPPSVVAAVSNADGSAEDDEHKEDSQRK